MLWIKVRSVECGKLVDWAACVCATINYPGPTVTWSAMFAHFACSVNSCPCNSYNMATRAINQSSARGAML